MARSIFSAARSILRSVSSTDSTQARIGLPWPSYLSLLEEMSAEGHALIGAAFELSAERKAG
jgi:hypothetical protein